MTLWLWRKSLKYHFCGIRVLILVVLIEEHISTVKDNSLTPVTDLSKIRSCMEDQGVRTPIGDALKEDKCVLVIQ